MTENSSSEKKSRSQEKAIIALMTEPTIKQAAIKAGIGEATLWRWLQDPEFNEQYRTAKRQAVSQAVSRLQQACGEAADTLRTIMMDSGTPASSRVTAAKTVLETAFKAAEMEELEKRIEELEKLQGTNHLKGVRS